MPLCNHRIFSNLPRFYGLPVKPRALSRTNTLYYTALQYTTLYFNAEKDHQIYATRAARRPRCPDTGSRPALHTGRTGFRSEARGRLCLAGARDGFVRRTSPALLSAPVVGGQHAAGRQGRYAPQLRQALAGCRPVAPGSERGRHPELRAGAGRRPLQGFAGGHGHAPFGGSVVPGCGQGRPLGKYGRHRQPRPVGCRCPAGHNASGSERGSGQHGRTAVDDRHRETLGGKPGFRDADGTCRIGTLRPPGRRHGG